MAWLSCLYTLSHQAELAGLISESFAFKVPAPDFALSIQGESQPSMTMAAMVRADERLEQGFAKMTLPLLILHGSADKATQPSGSQQFFDQAGSVDKTLKIYDGHYHDLSNDKDKQLVMQDSLGWLLAQVAKISAA